MEFEDITIVFGDLEEQDMLSIDVGEYYENTSPKITVRYLLSYIKYWWRKLVRKS